MANYGGYANDLQLSPKDLAEFLFDPKQADRTLGRPKSPDEPQFLRLIDEWRLDEYFRGVTEADVDEALRQPGP